jgi:hypothetical protein
MSSLARSSGALLLNRLLEQPQLVEAVQGLPPQALGKLVERVGLEDAGELVALASTEQVAAMLDEDLFEAGDLDPARFIVWLEVMLEAGDAFAAGRLAELDEDLLTLALQRLVLVLDLEDLATWASGRKNEKALEGALGEELHGYQLVARHPDRWDAVLAALLALDREHPELVERTLGRCAHLSGELIDELGGLHAALSAEDSLGEDVHAGRDARRADAGFVSASDAEAFLKGASRDGAARGRDPVTREYLAAAAARPPEPQLPPVSQRLMKALGESAGPRALRLPSSTTPPRFVAELKALRDRPELFARRMSEVAYLCNVLVAAKRKLRPADALTEVVEVCSRGLERDGRSLEGLGADHFFKVGWVTR